MKHGNPQAESRERGSKKKAQNSKEGIIALPHKVFVWDKQGRYEDYAFPNPIHGHLLGGQNVLGKKIEEVLPFQAAQILKEALTTVYATRKRRNVEFVLQGKTGPVEVAVQLIPCCKRVMGWVTDTLLESKFSTPNREDKTASTIMPEEKEEGIHLTPREQEVLVGIGLGKTNPEIGETCDISERMVRFHLANLFRKYRVTSRLQLARKIMPDPSRIN